MSRNKEMIKIDLIDLNHMALGVQTNLVPYGIGLIAHYLKSNVKHKFDIRLFKNPFKFLSILKTRRPDILGITQYAWNSELNLYMAQLVKKNCPDCIIIAGGPNLYLSREQKLGYLKQNNFIDLCVSYDGEIPFAEIVKRLIVGEKIEDIRRDPVAGAYSIDAESGEFVESKEPAPRLNSLDVFGSIYAEGFFEGMLDEGFQPLLQTQRGCPFKCSYCHTSDDYYSRVIFQSVDNFRQDMEYLGRRFAGQHNVTLHLANINFGLFKTDFEIAWAIRNIQDKYDWPRNINLSLGNNPKRLEELLPILKYKIMLVSSLQTLTPVVLRNIRRKNMPYKTFVEFQNKAIRQISENTATELILSLPGETGKSFLKTVSLALNSGAQNIIIYTLMALRGTPIASLQIARRYGHMIRHRIVPRCFSRIGGVKIFETEEVVVATKNMPFKDYIDLRGLALTITVFASSIEMFPLRKFLMEHNISIAEWAFGIQKNIPKFPKLYSAYKNFLKETRQELFFSRKAIIDFFSKKNNYKRLCAGEFGDNLLRKYKTIMLSRYYRHCLEISLHELKRQVKGKTDLKRIKPLINDLKLYLMSRDIGCIFKNGYNQDMQRDVVMHYDIQRWLDSKQDNAFLKNYSGLFPYSIVVTNYMRKRLKSFNRSNRDPELSLQILYRDGYIKDYWPQWVYRRSHRSQ